MNETDKKFMILALAEAEKAAVAEEVPVGAVVVLNKKIIGSGHNQVIAESDPSAHAEIVALRAAARKIGNYRVLDATVYVTLEPCLMCYSAMVSARVARLVYAAGDPKTGIFSTGAFAGVRNIYNHEIKVESGLMDHQCAGILRDFFKERRGAGAVERGGLENR